MKKVILILSILLLPLSAAVAADIPVATLDELVGAVRSNPSAHIRLAADINVASLTAPIDVTFKGTLDGSGFDASGNAIYHTIGGVAPAGGHDGRARHPLFKDVDGATFNGVVFCHYRLESNDDNLGVVAPTLSNATFENVGFANISVWDNDDYAGTITGKATDCTFTSVRVVSSDVTVDGNRVGAMAGYSTGCTFTGCTTSVDTRVFADGNGVDAYAGGLVGESAHDKFRQCVNLGMVGGSDDRVGGLVGYSEYTNYYNCSNSGFVCQVKDEDEFHMQIDKLIAQLKDRIESVYDREEFFVYLGITGAVLQFSVAFLVALSPLVAGISFFVGLGASVIAIVYGAIIAWEGHDELGGIAGGAQAGLFSACSNYGCCYGIDSSVGGICGEIGHTFYSEGAGFDGCLNAGSVHGGVDVGGIVGHMEDSHVNNCLNVGEVSGENPKSTGTIFGAESDCGWNNNFFLGTSYDRVAGGRVSVTGEQLSSGIVAWWLNGGRADGPWHQNIGGDAADAYPVLDASHDAVTGNHFGNSYSIATADELAAFAQAVNGSAGKTCIGYLTADIDMREQTGGITNWTPIGTQSNPFTGLFYGGGHTIDYLACRYEHSTDDIDVGLFGTLGMRAEIHDVILGEHSSIYSTQPGVGGIAGSVRVPDLNIGTVTISGCGNLAPITGKHHVGGIVGGAYDDTKLTLVIADCFNRGAIRPFLPCNPGSNTGESGAICGYTLPTAVVRRCWNDGLVEGLYFDGVTPFPGHVSNHYFLGGDNTYCDDCYNLADLVKDSSCSQKGVSTFTADQVASGELAFLLNGGHNDVSDPGNLYWCQTLTGTTYPVPGQGGVSYSRTVTPKEGADNTMAYYGTICLPIAVASTDDLKFFVLDPASGFDVLSFNSVDVLPAGTPALFRNYGGGDLTFLGADDEFQPEPVITPSDDQPWCMKGHYARNFYTTDADLLARLYYISNGEVRHATRSLSVGAYRAYIESQPYSGEPPLPSSIRIRLDGEYTTDIAPLLLEPRAGIPADAVAYDLQGRRVHAPQHGIYIVGGRKVLVP